jgi:asparagine synthase (glutamine-hydrolysing)
MGFAVPIGDWLRDSLRPMLHDLLNAADSFAAANFRPATIARLIAEHQDRRANHSQRLYALLMLELWWKANKRGRS